MASMSRYFIAPDFKRIDKTEPRSTYTLSAIMSAAERFVISGPPGAGKTTILRYLQAELGKIKTHTDFLSLSGISSSSDFSSILPKLLASCTTLLLDDLDAVPREHEVAICQNLQEAISSYPNVRVVIATRRIVLESSQALIGFAHFEVLPFNEHQISEFINRYSRRPAELRLAIRGSQKLSSVSSNPLLLKMLSEYEDALLSANLILDPQAILRESIRLAFSHAVTRVQLPEGLLRKVMRVVATELALSGRLVIDPAEIGHLTPGLSLTPGTPSAVAEVVEALTTTGLMVKSDHCLTFVHRIIQEYFLTDYLRSDDRDLEADVVLNRNKDVVASLRLVGRPDMLSLHAFSRLQESTPPIPCDVVFPLYARNGSIELFLAFVGVSAAGFALSKFLEGFLKSLGERAAGRLRKQRTLSGTVPRSVIELAPDWIRNNPRALERFLQNLTDEYGRTAGRVLSEVDLTARYLKAVYETTDEGSVIVVVGEEALTRLEKDPQ